jgi:hypothetical protein
MRRLYGRALDMNEVGVTCADGGYFYSKAAKGFSDYMRPHMLSVQDPLDAKNDTARSSWNIKTVRGVSAWHITARTHDATRVAPREAWEYYVGCGCHA